MSSTADRRPDSQQLVRQWALLRLLSEAPQPYSIKQLADQLGVSKATIERDIATLERDFAVVEESAGKQKKTYRIDQKVKALESLTFGVSELLAIYAAHAMLSPLSGTPVHDDINSVVMKIRGFLGPRHNGGLQALSRVFAPHPRGHIDYERHREVIDELADAIARRLVCKLTYHSTWKGTTRTHAIRPLKLVWHQSALYLMACVAGRSEITAFVVHRVRELVVTTEVFVSPRVDVEAHIAKAFGIFVSDKEVDVEIVFDAEIAWRIEERTYHPAEAKQRIAGDKLRYRLRSSAQWEIIPWVQSFGAHAELVAPVEWRQALRSNAEAMAARYAEA